MLPKLADSRDLVRVNKELKGFQGKRFSSSEGSERREEQKGGELTVLLSSTQSLRSRGWRVGKGRASGR